MSTTDQSLPPFALTATFRVQDFDRWKAGFEANEGLRKRASIVGHHINRAEDDPNLVSVYLALTDLDEGKAFTTSDELKSVMKDVGVISPPEFRWMAPVRDAVVWDRELPAFMLSHRVSNFEEWLDGYNDADSLREQNGIVGHAASQALDDPSVALVYHQAESFDTLRDFLDNDELKSAMKDAGVSSEPAISFVTGGWAKMY